MAIINPATFNNTNCYAMKSKCIEATFDNTFFNNEVDTADICLVTAYETPYHLLQARILQQYQSLRATCDRELQYRLLRAYWVCSAFAFNSGYLAFIF